MLIHNEAPPLPRHKYFLPPTSNLLQNRPTDNLMKDTRNFRAGAQTGTRSRQSQPKKCPECGQVFSKTEHLARHIRSHTKERPFGCDACGRSYSRHDSLLRHARTHVGHNGDHPTLSDVVVSPPPSHSGTDVSLAQSQVSNNISLFSASTQQSYVESDRVHATTLPETLHRRPQEEECIVSSRSPVIVQNHEAAMVNTAGASGGNAVPEFSVFPASILNPHNEIDNTATKFNTQEPTWLLGEEFDLNALNTSISTALLDWAQYPVTVDPSDQRFADLDTNPFGRLNPFLPSQETAASVTTTVQQKWYTRLSRGVTPQPSNDQFPAQDGVDDMYREGLSHKLQPCISNPSLPSADFLNLCVKLYFSRFNPVIPLLHAPSFRPSSENALVLLSICSIGALFIGTASATAQGRRIFQILNKAILATWETYMRRGSGETLSLIQAAAIGQTFGMLSGQSQDLCMTETFHGTIVALSRQVGLFNIRDSLASVDGDGGSSPEYAWKRWAQAEESIRLVLALHVHDAEFATTFHHEPLMRHKVKSLPLCCSDELFSAVSATEWQSLVRTAKSTELSKSPEDAFLGNAQGSQLPHRRSMMFWYASLAGILASIQEARVDTLSDSDIQHFQDLLLQWHHDHAKALRGPRNHPIGLIIMWHVAHIALYTDLNLLESAIGRDGHVIAEQTTFEVRMWAASPEGRRTVLHASLLLRRAEALSVSLEPAIQVPKALFISAIVIYCYTKLGLVGKSQLTLQNEMTMPELLISWPGLSSHLDNGSKCLPVNLQVDLSIFCSAIDLLRRIGHWEISRRYASILECLLDDFTKS